MKMVAEIYVMHTYMLHMQHVNKKIKSAKLILLTIHMITLPELKLTAKVVRLTTASGAIEPYLIKTALCYNMHC